ncbi:hypothetical protein HK099_000278 [Clydaea vesicula]|uniref:Uncharacterized protein n=1 Tax=Clydaea vesicula TaxID=447962 RepID=A0AAD5U4B4_9FUNG|nr:hypothetical protein HK099_000278 [Clydaea vesicula]
MFSTTFEGAESAIRDVMYEYAKLLYDETIKTGVDHRSAEQAYTLMTELFKTDQKIRVVPVTLRSGRATKKQITTRKPKSDHTWLPYDEHFVYTVDWHLSSGYPLKFVNDKYITHTVNDEGTVTPIEEADVPKIIMQGYKPSIIS